MSAPVLAFLPTRQGIGTTSMVYHLAWMFEDEGLRTLLVDLDPQAHLTAAFLDEDQLDGLWNDGERAVLRAMNATNRDAGGTENPGDSVRPVSDLVGLVPGDPDLASVDGASPSGGSRLARWLRATAGALGTDVVLLDLAPRLGALERAALLAADRFVVAVEPHPVSLRFLSTLGSALEAWRERSPTAMEPLGYVLLEPIQRLDRPRFGADARRARIPSLYRDLLPPASDSRTGERSECLGILNTYPSLSALAREARKPIFHLKPADGAGGAHLQAVREARGEYEDLVRTLRERMKEIP